MKSFILCLALLIAGYTSSFADNYFQDTLWMNKTDQSDGFYKLKFSKNDSIIAGFGYEKTIFYESKTGKEIARIDGNGFGRFINNDSQFIRVAVGNTEIEILDTKTWQRVGVIENEGLAVGSFDLTTDEKYLIAVIKNGIRKWDLTTRQIIKTKTFGVEPKTLKDFRVTNLRITSDKSKLLYEVFKSYIDTLPPYKVFERKYATISDFNTLDSIDNYLNPSDYALSKNSKYIALKTGSNNGVEIYDFASKQLLHKLPVNGLNVTGLEFTSDEKYLVTSDQYANMNTWDVLTGKSEFEYVNGCTSNFNISHNQKNIIWSCSRLLSLYNTHWSSTSVNEQTQILPILYPNPTNGFVNINTNYLSSQLQYTITNASGQILQTNTAQNINGQIQLNLTQYSKGTYFIRLECNQEVSNYKLVKE